MTNAAAELVVDDRVLGRLAGYATSQTPGVARLQPTVSRRVTRGAVEFARRGLTRADADADAVEVERAAGSTGVTVRIVATGKPPILETVSAIHTAVADVVSLHIGVDVDVCVLVVDVESDPANTNMP